MKYIIQDLKTKMYYYGYSTELYHRWGLDIDKAEIYQSKKEAQQEAQGLVNQQEGEFLTVINVLTN